VVLFLASGRKDLSPPECVTPRGGGLYPPPAKRKRGAPPPREGGFSPPHTGFTGGGGLFNTKRGVFNKPALEKKVALL